MRSLSFFLSSWKLPYQRHTGWEQRFCDIAVTLQFQQLVDGVFKKTSCKISVSESNRRVCAETAVTARHRVQKGLKKITEDILCCLRSYEGTFVQYMLWFDVGTQHSPEMLVGLQNGVDVPFSTVKAVSHVPTPTSTPILLNLRRSFIKVGTTTGNRCLWKWTEMNWIAKGHWLFLGAEPSGFVHEPEYVLRDPCIQLVCRLRLCEWSSGFVEQRMHASSFGLLLKPCFQTCSLFAPLCVMVIGKHKWYLW